MNPPHEQVATVRLGRSWLILLAVLLAHCCVAWNWSQQTTYPARSWHNNQLTQAVYVMILSGASRVQHLPPESLWQVPPDEPGFGRWQLLSTCADPRMDTDSYFATSLFLLLSSLLPLIFGLDPNTLLWGTVLPVGALLAATFLAARSFLAPSTAAAAAVLLTLLPVSIAAMQTAFPFLGLMIGPVLVVAALFASDRFRRIGWVILAAYFTALIPRWGESAGDALRSLVATSCVVVVLGASTARTRQRRRRCAGLLVYCVVAFLLVDKGWLYFHATQYVIPRVTEGDSIPLATRLSEIVLAFVGYLVIGAKSMFGLPATVVVLTGVTGLVASFRRKRRAWKVHITAVVVWFVLPILLVCVPSDRQSFYVIGSVPPLIILTAAGLREIPRIGRRLPWVGVLVLVPAYVALRSPILLERWFTTQTPPFAHYALATSTMNRALEDVDPYGISHSPLLTFHHPPLDSEPTDPIPHDFAALDWAIAGAGHEVFETMPRGSLVVAVSGDNTPFDTIGALLQAAYPHIVFREFPMIPSRYEFTCEDYLKDQGKLVPAIFQTRRERTYLATFHSNDDTGPPTRPPWFLGSTIELVRGDEVGLYEVVAPPCPGLR